MISKSVVRGVVANASAFRAAPVAVSVRGMATERQLRDRMAATANIHKITKSMKMVSAAKLRGDQNRLESAKPFAQWAAKLNGEKQLLEGVDVSKFPSHNLIICCYTDKGLCGGVNTVLSRMIKGLCNSLDAQGKTYELVVLGDKGKSQLSRSHGNKISRSVLNRNLPYSFDLACGLAQDCMNEDYEGVHVVYNHFKSAIEYLPSIKTINPMLDNNADALNGYTMVPKKHPEVLLNLYEYSLATQIYHSLLENATSEQSSRMSAMENASKNASEMIDTLTLQYNRARQARITTELIEIISGASALEG
jgi:F-type H+-transporting ATPase subunit gamma